MKIKMNLVKGVNCCAVGTIRNIIIFIQENSRKSISKEFPVIYGNNY
jgi:hypothetical protein